MSRSKNVPSTYLRIVREYADEQHTVPCLIGLFIPPKRRLSARPKLEPPYYSRVWSVSSLEM